MQAKQSLPQHFRIINFSHPIPDDDTSIIRLLPDLSSFQILDIPVQLDLNKPLAPQIEPLVDAAVVAANENIRNIDYIRLPGFAEAAVLVVSEFQARGYRPNIIRFAKAEGLGPPRFEAVEILHQLTPSPYDPRYWGCPRCDGWSLNPADDIGDGRITCACGMRVPLPDPPTPPAPTPEEIRRFKNV